MTENVKLFAVTFCDRLGYVYTATVEATAPRKALRQARRKLEQQGITGLRYQEVRGYYDTGTINENGFRRIGIRRFPLAWKW